MNHMVKVENVKYSLEIYCFKMDENYIISYDPIPNPYDRKLIDSKAMNYVRNWWKERNNFAHNSPYNRKIIDDYLDKKGIK